MKVKDRRLIIYLLIPIFGLMAFSSFKKDYFEVSKQLDIFASLFKELNIYYVDDIQPDELIHEAINSMLETLDPYTTYMTEEESEDFKVHTSGEYAGIGASIRNIDNEVVIVQTYEGFAAHKSGLRAGDVIIGIDNNNMENKDSDEVSSLLKGSIGSETLIKVKRSNAEFPLSVKLKREKIIIKAVPFFGMVNKDVGYIVLNSFSNKANLEVSSAYDKLKKQGMKYLILDFRGNPGGLLSQAVSVSNLFLPKNTFVVETKGRIKDWNKKYHTRQKAKDLEIPIVILTNYGTASASEIVAGAFQDLDRAVIMGDRTYGKGLVQQPRSLTYGTQLKITIAKYYIPSGRSIQARDYFDRNEDGSVRVIPDSLKVTYKTNSGRIVYDGGGIEPDVNIDIDDLTKFSENLISEGILFNYSVKYCNSTEGPVDLNTFELSESDYNNFKNYVSASEVVFESELEIKLEELVLLAKEEDIYPELEYAISDLELMIEKENNNLFVRNDAQIKRLLSLSIVNNDHFERGRYLYNINRDKVISKASLLLQNQNEYNSILSNNTN